MKKNSTSYYLYSNHSWIVRIEVLNFISIITIFYIGVEKPKKKQNVKNMLLYNFFLAILIFQIYIPYNNLSFY